MNQAQTISSGNGGDRPVTTVGGAIAAQMQRTPSARAAWVEHRWWSFGELDAASGEVAQHLAAAGIGAGSVVAVLLPRGADLLLNLLALHRLGACCVPLDLESPRERLDYCLTQSGASHLIGAEVALYEYNADALALLTGPATFVEAAGLRHPISGAAPAWAVRDDAAPFCILHTSGSTGRPKGVLLSQLNVYNCLAWMQVEYPLGAADVMLHKTPIGFDVSMYELFWPLMAGAAIVVAEEGQHKDPAHLAELVQQHRVTAAHFVPAMLAAFVDEPDSARCPTLTRIFAAGEALSWALVRRVRAQLPQARVFNLYGPTEGGVVSQQACDGADRHGFVPIGRPVWRTTLHVLDDHLKPLPRGAEGELYIGGAQVALGYVNQPGLTAERFIDHPEFGRLYRSGDYVQEDRDGALLYCGRRDQQVKLRGVRIELGEVEAALLAHPAISAAAAGVRDVQEQPALVAWFLAREAVDESDLRAFLEDRLTAAMLPQHLVSMSQMPHLTSGKIDRRALPLPTPETRPATLLPPGNELQYRLGAIWREVLGGGDIGIDRRFFEIGGSSLLAVRIMGHLRQALGRRVPLARFFEAPTIRDFAALLERDYAAAVTRWLDAGAAVGTPAPAPSEAGNPPSDRAAASAAPADAAGRMPRRESRDEPIAIIGMACRVPGADDLDAFWDLVASGREGLREFTEAELSAAGVSAEQLADPGYVRRGGALGDPFGFDAGFFGYSPREAELTDPQQRLLLECAWHALEDAGLPSLRGTRVGVYAGLARNQYFDRQLATHASLRAGDDGFATLLGNDKDYAATRIAFKLDLRGPAITLQTACSSSGVAVHLASQALRAGECEAALVGGVRLNLPHTAGYAHVDGGPQSSDGRVRPFDAAADGMVLSSGVAMLVLKPLSRALADGDRVYATLLGTALNNDGAAKAGYTAPSLTGQVDAISQALQVSGVDAASIGLVEAHGTGTALGDPIEVAALARAYAGADRIALGSVKGNVGHLDAGAGAIGLVKAALALAHRQLPPSIHYERANPECAFEETPFFVNTHLVDWPSVGPRRAAVSSFGFGGTNFHGVLEEAPATVAVPAAAEGLALLRLSAHTDGALREQARRLAGWLRAHPDAALADVAHTLDRGRSRLTQRAAVVAADHADAIQRLEKVGAGSPAPAQPSLVFMFPGQGAQYVGMGRELYASEPLFRDLVDHCAQRLAGVLAVDLRQVLYPDAEEQERAARLMATTEYAQPAIFAVSYATAKLWLSRGLRPQAMVGHSLGELVAATLAGVFELDDALATIARRGALMQSMPAGGMLAVRLSEADVTPFLKDGVALAGLNSPQLSIVAGPHEALADLARELRKHDVASSALPTSHAFHSPMMDAVVEPFAQVVASVPRRAADQPIVSTLSGGWATAADLQEPRHWARQLREPVRFAPAIQTLLAQPGRVLLEVGPGVTLTTAVRQTLRPEHGAAVIASLPHADQAAGAQRHWVEAIGKLSCAGIELDPAARGGPAPRRKLSLPGYPFEHQHHEIAAIDLPTPMTEGVPAGTELPVPPEVPVEEPAGVLSRLVQVIDRLTGVRFGSEQHEISFLDLGMDSLTLTQLATRVKSEFKIEVRFRKLMEDLGSIRRLTEHLEANGAASNGPTVVPLPARATTPAANDAAAAATPAAAPAAFGAGARIAREKKASGLSDKQQQAITALTGRYLARTRKSREYAAAHRAVLADPRTVSGFRPEIKELVYPIVVNRSEGSYLWDLDGNGYVDATCGFGSMFFGHRPSFVSEAMSAQLELGWEIGPQTPLAGECAQLFTQATGLARVAFCNTGSEAVIAAVRLARTVTGKNLIVSFVGDYHGIQDEVIVRAGAGGRSIPAAPGIPAESVANTLILEYGSPDALRIIRERAEEIAGVLIEPIQSRHPDLQPRDFLQSLRQLTREADIAFIMDEVITGFRGGLRGAQGYFGVEADIATYGKVFGGGMPIGAVAGCARFLDALDGGTWQYGDDSVPEAGVTYFAGTFVRHPLTLAAVRASLKMLLDHPQWPGEVAAKARRMVERINADFAAQGAPMRLERFASLFKPLWNHPQTQGDLLFFFMRERGIHIWEGRPCFLSLAHSDVDIEQIVDAFRHAVAQMKAADLFDLPPAQVPLSAIGGPRPPLPGARIGRDAAGAPAWFLPDAQRPGYYVQIEQAA